MKHCSQVALMLAMGALQCLVCSAPVRSDSRDEISPLLVRAQLTQWPQPTRKPPERIVWNDAGQLIVLLLDGVKLEPGDVERIRSYKSLERLSLNRTSISDQELATLSKLPNLQGLALNYTAIGDDGVASLAKFPRLKSVCLGKVQASPDAVRKLKLEQRRLQIGYSPLRK